MMPYKGVVHPLPSGRASRVTQSAHSWIYCRAILSCFCNLVASAATRSMLSMRAIAVNAWLFDSSSESGREVHS